MTRRDEILEVLIDYAKDHVGNSPSIRDLLSELHKRKYTMGRGTLHVHLIKLEAEQRIKRKDGKLIVIGADWIPPDEAENPPIQQAS